MVDNQLHRSIAYKSFIITLFGLIASLSCFGQMNYLGDTMSFSDVIRIGLMNNYNIQLSKQNTEQFRGSLMNAHGRLNPYLDVVADDNSGEDPTLTYGNYKDVNVSFVVPTSFGAYFSAGGSVEREVYLLDAPYDLVNIGGEWAGVTLPLLRGLGKYNTTNATIFALRNYYTSKKYALSDDIIKYVRDVTIAYVQLQTAIGIYNVRQKDVEYAEKYVTYIQEMIDHNQIAPVEIDRAQSFVYNYKEQLISAKNDVYNAYYTLNKIEGKEKKESAGMDERIPVCTDSISTPAIIPLGIINNDILTELDTLIARASYFKSLEYNREGAEMEMKGAKNSMLNQLDLSARIYNYGATGGNEEIAPESKFWDVFNSPNSASPGTSVLVTLAYHLPIKNEINKGTYLNRKANYEYQQDFLEKTRYESTNGAANLISNLNNMIQLYKSNTELDTIQQRTYQNEFKKYKLGAASQLDIISAYQDFAETRVRQYQLQYTIYNNVIQLKYLIGSLPDEKTKLEKSDLQDILNISNL